MRFKNREHAAYLLADRLAAFCGNKNPLVLGVPRGGVPMAQIIADALGGEMDVVLVHKLRHPDQEELAIGAVDETGSAFLSDWANEVDSEYIEAEKQRQLAVLRERRAQYTPRREPIDPHGRIVIVVDDGIATGSTMTAALRSDTCQESKEAHWRRRCGIDARSAGDAARVRRHGVSECARRLFRRGGVLR